MKEDEKRKKIMVGVAGFEPATPASRTQCSTGLSHTPTWNAAYSLGFRSPQGADLRKLITVNVGLKTQILPAGEAAVVAAARVLADRNRVEDDPVLGPLESGRRAALRVIRREARADGGLE